MYCTEIGKMLRDVCEKQPTLVNKKHSPLLVDNAEPRMVNITKNVVQTEVWSTLAPTVFLGPSANKLTYIYASKSLTKIQVFKNKSCSASAFRHFIVVPEQRFFWKRISSCDLLGWQRYLCGQRYFKRSRFTHSTLLSCSTITAYSLQYY